MDEHTTTFSDFFTNPGLKKKFEDKNIEQLVYEYQLFDTELRSKEEEIDKLQDVLNQLNNRYQELFVLSPLGLIVLYPDFRIKEANHTASTLLNIPSVLLVNKNINQFILPPEQELFSQAFQHALEQDFSMCIDSSLYIDKYQSLKSRIQIIPLHQSYNEHKMVLMAFYDISREHQAEQQLKDLRHQAKQLLNTVPSGVFTVDIHGIINSWNHQAEVITGFSSKEAIGKSSNHLFPDNCLGVNNLLFNENHPAIKNYNCNMIKKDGTKQFVIKHCDVLKNAEGKLIGGIECFEALSPAIIQEKPSQKGSLYINAEDIELISSDKGLKEALRQSIELRDEIQKREELYRLISENSKDVICLHDNNARFLFISDSCYELSGYKPEELLGKDPCLYIHPDDIDAARQYLFSLNTTEKKHEPIPFRIKNKEGNYIWVETNAKFINSPLENTKRFQTSTRNIQLRKETLELLEEREQNLNALLSSMDDLVIEMNSQMEFTNTWGKSTNHLFFPKDYIIGKNIREILPQLADSVIEAINKSLSELHPVSIEYCHPENKSIYYQATINPILKKDNTQPDKVSVFIRDISESHRHKETITDLNTSLIKQKNALEELNFNLEQRIKTEVEKNRKKDELFQLHSRHAAMGEMISNIAHQWRQPLNAINLLVYDILDAYQHQELDLHYLKNNTDEIQKIIQQMSATINNFRSFFQHAKEKTWFSLSEQIPRTLNYTDVSFHSLNIHIELKLENDLYVYGYPNEFSQVLLNILNNACDAFKKLDIQGESFKPLVSIHTKQNKDEVHIIISDNAGGIPNDALPHIFKPYFTANKSNDNIGLGLFTSKSIIEKNMNGQILGYNNETGAVFEIHLPLQSKN